MKRLLIATWLTLPVAAYAYHMGPGQEHLRLDEAAALIVSADAHAAEAVRLTGARQVDLSSGVESAPGVKDPDRIRAFCAAAQAAALPA